MKKVEKLFRDAKPSAVAYRTEIICNRASYYKNDLYFIHLHICEVGQEKERKFVEKFNALKQYIENFMGSFFAFFFLIFQ